MAILADSKPDVTRRLSAPSPRSFLWQTGAAGRYVQFTYRESGVVDVGVVSPTRNALVPFGSRKYDV